MTASKKVSSAFGEALQVNGWAFPRRKKTLSVLPHTVHNVRFYWLFRSVVKMNTEWLAVSKLSENDLVGGSPSLQCPSAADHLTGANQSKVSKI